MSRILVVEDNPVTRKMFRIALETDGHEVVEAADGAASLRAAAESAPDLILQDLVLPDVDGYELARRLRALPKVAATPIVAISGFQGAAGRLESSGGEFVDFLFKPIEPSRLLPAVRGYLAPRPRAPEGRARASVLLVEDDPVQLRLLSTQLSLAGYEVATAADGEEALAAARRAPPAVILSDVLMPRLDGFRLAAAVRADPALARVPVVLVSSAYDEAADKALARRVGANALVPRGPGLDAALEALARALREGPVSRAEREFDPSSLEEYTHRVVRQLERLASIHARLSQRLALQEAELALLGELADAARGPGANEHVLERLLSRSLDAAGVSLGAAFVGDERQGLTLRCAVGWRDEGERAVRDLFGRPDLVRAALRAAEPIRIWRASSEPGAEELLGSAGAEAMLLTPLHAGEERLGVLAVATASGVLSEEWISFVRACGAQIGQALALARAFSQRDRAARRHEAIARLCLETIALGDPGAVMSAIVESVARVLEVDLVGIVEVDPCEGSVVVRAGHGLREGAAAPPDAPCSRPEAETLGAHVMRTRETAVAADLASDPRFRRSAFLLAQGAVSGVAAPVIGEGRPVALLEALTRSPRRFEPDEVEFVEAVAGILASALARAQAERRLETLHAVDRAIAEGSDLAGAGPRILEALGGIGIRFAALWTADGAAGALRCRAAWGAPGAATEAFEEATLRHEPRAGGLLADAFARREPAWLERIGEVPRFARAGAAGASGLVSALVAPIISGDAALGALEVYVGAPGLARAQVEGVVRQVASQVGQFIARLRAAEALRDSERQFRQAQKMEAIGRLAGGVAHDFNNLITAMIGYCDLALPGLRQEDPLRVDVEEIKKAAQRAAALTQQLLAFSRKAHVEMKVVDVNALLTGSRAMLRRLIGEDITIKLETDPSLGHVRADPGQLEQVIMNLCVNARDAMPEGGTLVLETRNAEVNGEGTHPRAASRVRPGRYVLLAVTDTGSGMDAETLTHVFEPFFTTKEAGKGTGLGLSTVYGIIEKHGGHISVYSEPGKGTTFKVYLPRIDAGAAAAPARAGPSAALRGSETVLLVEDEEIVRELSQRVLKLYGYRVVVASDGAEGLAAAERHEGKIDLLVTDVVMPRVSGPELARRLAEKRPETRVLFLSGYTERGAGHLGVAGGKAAFLMKPFSPDAFARKVREALDGPPPAP
jgi:CheY-like chemotaxis protein